MRVNSNDYSVDPAVIGRLVDIHADLTHVTITCAGRQVARHERCWGWHQTIRDETHLARAAALRADLAARRAARHHADGHQVPLRALPDYDELFGVDFHPTAAGNEHTL